MKQKKGHKHDRFATVAVTRRQSRPAVVNANAIVGRKPRECNEINESALPEQRYTYFLKMNVIIVRETEFG